MQRCLRGLTQKRHITTGCSRRCSAALRNAAEPDRWVAWLQARLPFSRSKGLFSNPIPQGGEHAIETFKPFPCLGQRLAYSGALRGACGIRGRYPLPSAQAASGSTVGLDTRHFYTPEEAFSTVASYGDDGRAMIRMFYLTVDIVNPALYTSALILLISWLFQRGFKSGSKMQKLNVFPVGAAIFDLLENLGIVTMLTVYPAQPTIVAWLSTVGTTTKYFFIYQNFTN